MRVRRTGGKVSVEERTGHVRPQHSGRAVPDCLRLAVASAAACVRSMHTSEGVQPAGTCLAAADAAGYRPTGLS